MYTDWFQLTDKPFSITPDPRYLFLSERHREALAHLLYGVTESGGFIQLTGEVGMGKTTLTRTLLEQLPESVDVALVYNAHASLTEFLESICDELHVERPVGHSTPKHLTDLLNAYLLDAHARSRRTVLIVDEAQNLGPELLEQVRLLTNLETHRDKLLQIILIGQPELRETLARNDLRQLAQRITARYHLEPLDAAETHAYVKHRLEVAGARRPIFTTGALRAIYKASKGIPRLINILAERALLGAFAARVHEVNASMIRMAANEVRGKESTSASLPRLVTAMVMTAIVVGVAGWIYWYPVSMPATVEQAAATPAPAPAPAMIPEPIPELPAQPALTTLLERDDDLGATTAQLLHLWQVGERDGLPSSLCSLATDNGLACARGRGTWNNLRVLNRPALLELRVDAQTRTLLITQLGERDAEVWLNGATFALPLLELDLMWLGDYLILWRPPLPSGEVLRRSSRSPAVEWLREALGAWAGVPPSPVGDVQFFDSELEDMVRAFQSAMGLGVDGIAGEQTLVHLDGLLNSPGPSLGNHEHVPDS